MVQSYAWVINEGVNQLLIAVCEALDLGLVVKIFALQQHLGTSTTGVIDHLQRDILGELRHAYLHGVKGEVVVFGASACDILQFLSINDEALE